MCRDSITLLGTAVAWLLAARAQQPANAPGMTQCCLQGTAQESSTRSKAHVVQFSTSPSPTTVRSILPINSVLCASAAFMSVSAVVYLTELDVVASARR